MKNKTRINEIRSRVSWVAVLCLILFCMLFFGKAVHAEEDERYSFGHFYYHSHEGYVSICGYLGRETEVSIPSSISGKPVSEIESGAFKDCNTIEIITVPDTVVLVYEDSFTGASSLTKIISDTVGVTITADNGVVIEYTADQGEKQASPDSELNGGSSSDKNPDTAKKSDTTKKSNVVNGSDAANGSDVANGSDAAKKSTANGTGQTKEEVQIGDSAHELDDSDNKSIGMDAGNRRLSPAVIVVAIVVLFILGVMIAAVALRKRRKE